MGVLASHLPMTSSEACRQLTYSHVASSIYLLLPWAENKKNVSMPCKYKKVSQCKGNCRANEHLIKYNGNQDRLITIEVITIRVNRNRRYLAKRSQRPHQTTLKTLSQCDTRLRDTSRCTQMNNVLVVMSLIRLTYFPLLVSYTTPPLPLWCHVSSGHREILFNVMHCFVMNWRWRWKGKSVYHMTLTPLVECCFMDE